MSPHILSSNMLERPGILKKKKKPILSKWSLDHHRVRLQHTKAYKKKTCLPNRRHAKTRGREPK